MKNAKVICGLQEEMKWTNDMISKVHQEQVKFSGTEGLFMGLRLTPRETAQYEAMVQKFYVMTQIEPVGTGSHNFNSYDRNRSGESNSGENTHSMEWTKNRGYFTETKNEDVPEIKGDNEDGEERREKHARKVRKRRIYENEKKRSWNRAQTEICDKVWDGVQTEKQNIME